MTTSTNAILFYGFCWEEETNKPWHIGKEYEEVFADEDKDEDWEERYANAKGLQRPAVEYSDNGRDSTGNYRPTTPEQQLIHDQYWEAKRALIGQSQCEIGTHCSGSCPMPYVAITKSEITAYRGSMQEITNLRVEEDWDEQLRYFCSVMKIDVSGQEPGWWMVSYWST